ncbi:hypothetical protein AVEN_20712-1 [Araneus ventricosus]|uniref:Uncharacterized protein n=1 Tax=Araneus ventricosus TaxID=182803 RepID=A0A4Y2EJN2_ARAVE|nr:hypothetical protein AVEN_20712-1 [Araneus ventricosus]
MKEIRPCALSNILSIVFPLLILVWVPLGKHHEYVNEKSPDKIKGSRFPGDYNNGLGLPSAVDSACILPEGSGCGRRWLLGLRPQYCYKNCPVGVRENSTISRIMKNDALFPNIQENTKHR